MSRKILLTTTAIALAAGLTAAQAQSTSQDRSASERLQNSQSQSTQSQGTTSQGTTSGDTTRSGSQLNSTQEQNDRLNSKADRAQNTQSPQASPRGSQTGDNANGTSRSRASNSSASQPNSSARSASPSNERASGSTDRPASSNRASASQSSGRNAASSTASVKLTDQQRTRVAASISAQKVEPLTNVNFSISVGTRVPRAVRLHTVSADIVSTVPQYRGYSYFVTNDQIVIVEPRTYEIVSVLPYGSGGRTATTTSTKQKSSKFSSAQRDTIKKRIVARPARTTVTQTREITVGDEVPETIILENMPETVYTEVPGARPYRYYRTDRDVVIVDPTDRHIVDVLD